MTRAGWRSSTARPTSSRRSAYDLGAIVAWADIVRDRGSSSGPPSSSASRPPGAKQARFMNEHLPGVSVPDALIEALEASGPEAEAIGTAQCVEIVVGEIAGISGVHVMGRPRDRRPPRDRGAGLFPRPVGDAERRLAVDRKGCLDGDRHDPGTYLKQPLVVPGLSLITLGIYGLYWYFKVNEEIKRYTGDQTISPGRSFAAVFPGFLLIVPPFIAYYNTSNHIVRMQQQRGLASADLACARGGPRHPVCIGMVAYVQEHLNWSGTASGFGFPATPPPPSAGTARRTATAASARLARFPFLDRGPSAGPSARRTRSSA